MDEHQQLKPNQKPLCPMCCSQIQLRELIAASSGASGSVLLGGYDKDLSYLCTNYFGVCSVSVFIYNSYYDSVGKLQLLIGTASDWRDALKRYTNYCHFIEDHPLLKPKIFALADDKLEVHDYEHLMVEPTPHIQNGRRYE